MPHSFYPYVNKYREVIDFSSKMDADNYMRAGWDLIDTHTETFSGRSQNVLIYRVGWRRDAGEPVRPDIEDSPLKPGASVN